MKRQKKLAVLTGALIVVCAAAWAAVGTEKHKEKIENSDEVILKVPKDTVTSLSWEHDGKKLAFHKDETWVYEDDDAFPVSEKMINRLLENFEEFGVSFKIEDAEDLSQYGLDDPECTIELKTDDNTYDISLGDFSTMDSERYVSIGDGNVYLVKTDPMDEFDVELKDMIQNDRIPSYKTARQITFTGDDSYTITRDEDNDTDTCRDDDIFFAERDGKTVPLDTGSVNGYLNRLSGVSMAEYVTYKATDEEIAEYGLDDPEVTIAVDGSALAESTDDDGTDKKDDKEQYEDVSVTVRVSRSADDKKKAAKKADSNKDDSDAKDVPDAAYLRVDDSPIIYKISGDIYEELMEYTYNDLRHKEVLTADLDDITQIDFSLEGNTYSITSEKKGKDRVYKYEDEEISSDKLVSALKALKANEFTDEQPGDKEEIGLTLHLDRDGAPTVEISLYRYDGSNCLAVVDGAPVSLVTRSLVVDLVEAVHGIVLK